MKKCIKKILLFSFFLCLGSNAISQSQSFPWPEGKKMAMSLSFDDARTTNPTLGAALLNKYGVKATFFLVPSGVRKNIEDWKKAAASGHEMANHSLNHPCSGNFVWSRDKALEDYTMDQMRKELEQTNVEIQELLGVTPTVYAYPCGQTYLGRGANAQSFIPLISEMFLAGRGWLNEAPVDPSYADMAHLTGMKMDNMEFEEILPIIEAASANGQWLILAGHETNHSGNQTTYLNMLEKLAQYATDPANGIWIAPIGTIARYVQDKREGLADTVNIPATVKASPDGSLKLSAEKGKATGPEIKYMPEWKAFGWFTALDQVEWEVEIPQAGEYDVFLEWSVSDEEAGKPYVFETGAEKLTGQVEKSGSWETFKSKNIGQVDLPEGIQKMAFKPGSNFKEGALLDLREIRLVPVESPK
jgi:peptidoglycan/xylan/chitin deacetylase (PgdA/CDA1 family)